MSERIDVIDLQKKLGALCGKQTWRQRVTCWPVRWQRVRWRRGLRH